MSVSSHPRLEEMSTVRERVLWRNCRLSHRRTNSGAPCPNKVIQLG